MRNIRSAIKDMDAHCLVNDPWAAESNCSSPFVTSMSPESQLVAMKMMDRWIYGVSGFVANIREMKLTVPLLWLSRS